MERIVCRNCGNENVYLDTKDNKFVHCDCLDCNYQWSAPSIRSKAVVFNIVAGFIGVLLIIFGASMHTAVNGGHHQSPVVLLIVGMALFVTFTYRSLRTYRVI